MNCFFIWFVIRLLLYVLVFIYFISLIFVDIFLILLLIGWMVVSLVFYDIFVWYYRYLNKEE